MRHRVRRNWHAWADIGAGRPVVNMIRNGVRIPFKSGPGRFAPFSQRVSMEDATPDQLRFMDDELLAFWLAERGKKATARDRDYFTVNYRGKLYRRLAGLPMGWSLSPYYFCSSLTTAFNRHLRRPDFAMTSQAVRRAKLSIGRR
eukprot:jgi/Tetstr1/442547/TSEL_030645.t1